MWKYIKPLLNSLVCAVPITVVFIDKIGFACKIEGASMQPVLNPQSSKGKRDYVFLSKLACRRYHFHRGEIVSFYSPRNPDMSYIKRIVALEDDIVISRKQSTVMTRVPAGHCWVEGDNTINSYDSNSFGPVPLGLIYAKAMCIIWPPSRWRMLDHLELESDRVKHSIT